MICKFTICTAFLVLGRLPENVLIGSECYFLKLESCRTHSGLIFDTVFLNYSFAGCGNRDQDGEGWYVCALGLKSLEKPAPTNIFGSTFFQLLITHYRCPNQWCLFAEHARSENAWIPTEKAWCFRCWRNY